MSRLMSRSLQTLVLCSAGFLVLLLVTGCAGVVGPQISGLGSTPGTGVTPNGNSSQNTTPAPGSISFIGQVQSASNSSIVVKMPDGQPLTMNIVNGQTDLSDFNGALPSQGQLIQVDATTTTDGSFTATELKSTDSGDAQDQNVVTYTGLTTSTVGSDNVLHFRVGTRDYSFTLSATTDLTEYQDNTQSIPANQSVDVKVQYQGTNATVLEVGNANG